MPAEWQDTTLGACAEWLSGGTPSKSNGAFWSGTIPWVSAKDMKSFRLYDTEDHLSSEAISQRAKVVPAGTVLVLVRGMTLHSDVPICVAMTDMAFNQDLKALRAAKNVSPIFLAYWLLANKPDLLASVDHAGHGTGRLETKRLKAKRVRLPALAEQKGIASVLASLDDKIELNRRMNATLEAMARALFQSWFVDFDPVRAKLDSRKPLGLDDATAALFPDGFETANCDQIPSGWASKKLRDVADIQSGGTPAKGNPAFWGGEIPWITPKAMNGMHVHDSNERVTPAAVGNGTRVVPRGTTFVMVRGMGLHGGVRVSQARVDAAFNQDVKAIVPRGVDGTLVLFFLLNAAPALFETVHSSGHGTGVLATEFLEALTLAVPPAPLQQELVARLVALNDLIDANTRQSQTLATLRDTLLPKLLSGELRVRDVA